MLVHRRRHSSPQHDGSGVPGTNTQRFFSCCGYFLAAAYRSAHSSRGQALTDGATHVPLSSLLLVRAVWTSTQAGSQASSRPQTRGPSLVACAVLCCAFALPAPQEGICMRVCDWGLNGPLQLVHWNNWRKASRRDWRAAVDCHRVHARAGCGSRPSAYPMPWASFFTAVTNNCLRLIFFLPPPSVCVCVCVRVCVTDCENAGRSRDDSTTRRPHHDNITISTSTTTKPSSLLGSCSYPRGWPLSSDPAPGRFPADSQPNPGNTFAFRHTLSLTRTLYTPSLPIVLSHPLIHLRRPSSLLIHPPCIASSNFARLLCSSSPHAPLTAYAITEITAGQTWSDLERLEHQLRHPSTTTSTSRTPRAVQHSSSSQPARSPEHSSTRSVAISTPILPKIFH